MGNYVLNPNKATCGHVKRSYRQNVPAALKKLDLPNAIIYLDGAHGGVFGWRVSVCRGCIGSAPDGSYIDHPSDAALEFDRTWVEAGKPKQFRGLALNVGSYNAWYGPISPSSSKLLGPRLIFAGTCPQAKPFPMKTHSARPTKIKPAARNSTSRS